MCNSGNDSLANDITVLIVEAFSESAIIAIASCEDVNDPLSLLQKKQIFSSFAATLLDTRNRIKCVLDLDGIARECVGDTTKLGHMHSDITIEFETDGVDDVDIAGFGFNG